MALEYILDWFPFAFDSKWQESLPSVEQSPSPPTRLNSILPRKLNGSETASSRKAIFLPVTVCL